MTEIAEIYQNYPHLTTITLNFVGRVRSNRTGKKIAFMMVNDGTFFHDVQVVYKADLTNYETLTKVRAGALVEVTGKIILTPTKPQPFEIQALKLVLLSLVSENYPLQNKEQSLEFLRELSHLRARTKTFSAIFRIRSVASFAFHEYFHQHGFVYVQTPLITGNDAEGAGETFVVTTRQDANYQADFFGKKAVLTVSGQLHAEAFAQAFKKVYTFGPTFRAEESYTTRHAAEFWMIEPEVAFTDLQENIQLIEKMLKTVTAKIQQECSAELKFLAAQTSTDLPARFAALTSAQPFAIMTYREAIACLERAVRAGHKFVNQDLNFGVDLATEHERFLCEEIHQAPVFIIDYPKTIKSFYMKENPDLETVAAVDLLVPGIGELVGGSEREGDYQKLLQRCLDQGIDPQGLDWYLDLRRYGYYKSSGFGLGFERYLMYLTGVSNIRDVLLYPRTPRNLTF